MQTGAITSYIDVAQLTLYAFFIFFAGLIYYLRREDKREGYPLISDRPLREDVEGFPPMPEPKTFLLMDGSTVLAPRVEAPYAAAYEPGATWPGAPMVPTGNPMLDGVGAAAYAHRADVPEHEGDPAGPKIVPLRVASDFFLAWEDADPRGWVVLGADGIAAGTVVDAWIDRSETIIRYLEVTLEGAARAVLLPMTFAELKTSLQQVRVVALLAAHFADVPALRNPDQVTRLEEDRITSYYAGGLRYATPDRAEPLL